MAIRGDHDVSGLQIAVDDSLVVCLRHPLRNLGSDAKSPLLWQRPALQRLTELLASDELHCDECLTRDFIDLVDDGDVGMLESTCCLCLLNEAAFPVRVRNELWWQHLQSDFAVELHVEGAVDDSHSAAGNLLRYPVVRQRAPDHDGYAQTSWHSMGETTGVAIGLRTG